MYHVRLYRLYEVFNDKIFYGRQAEEALRSGPYIHYTNLALTGLHKRKLVKTAPRAEVREQFSDADFRKHYRKLTEEGLKVAKDIEDNKGLLTMFLLRQ